MIAIKMHVLFVSLLRDNSVRVWLAAAENVSGETLLITQTLNSTAVTSRRGCSEQYACADLLNSTLSAYGSGMFRVSSLVRILFL